MVNLNSIIHGDCLQVMYEIEPKSIDLIISDLPFGMTQNDWDKRLDMNLLWYHYERIIKENGAILLFGKGVFSAELIVSNKRMYRYSWQWVKNRATGHLNANRMPMQATEEILVFYKKLPAYNPQKTQGHEPVHAYYNRHTGSNYGKAGRQCSGGGSTERYPTNVLYYPVINNPEHPTEKPVPLLEFFVKTYSNEGDTVLDSCAGVATLGEACYNTRRNFICIEKELEFYDKGVNRMRRLKAS